MTPLAIAYEHTILMLRTSPEWKDAIKWVANIFTMISALAVSFSVGLAGEAFVFVGFFIGHIIWAVSAVVMKEKALMFINLGLIPIDIYAMYIRL